MTDDYLKKYEEEYEAVYGTGATGGDLGYDFNSGQSYNQQ